MAAFLSFGKIGCLQGSISSALLAGGPIVEELMYNAKEPGLLQRAAQARDSEKVPLAKTRRRR